MEQLPDLVIELINEYLSYEDLASLRVTCKRLKEFIDRKAFVILYMFVGHNPLNLRLFHTNQEICYANSLRVENFNFTATFRKRFQHLRRLVIHLHRCITLAGPLVHLDDWNCFEDLRQLQVIALQIDGRLSLKHLEIASFESMNGISERFLFKLDCPRLKALAVRSAIRPTLISDSNHLTHLLFGVLFRNGEEEDYLASFYSRLQNLRVVCFIDLNRLNDFLVRLNSGTLRLPSLSEIKLQDLEMRINDIESFNRMIDQLRVLGNNPLTKHIGLYMNERPMNLEQLLELSSVLTLPTLKGSIFRMTNAKFRILSESPVCEYLFPGECSLKINEESELDEDMIWKLRRTMSIRFKNKFELESHLFDLLIRTWRSVSSLTFKNVHIEPQLLEKMAKYLVNVFRLDFQDDRLGDFRFVTKFSNLSQVYLNFNLKRDDLKHLLIARPAAKRIKYFQITINCKHLQMMIFEAEDQFWIDMYKNEYGQTKQYHYFAYDLEHLLDFYYKMNLFEVNWQGNELRLMKGHRLVSGCLDHYSFEKPTEQNNRA